MADVKMTDIVSIKKVSKNGHDASSSVRNPRGKDSKIGKREKLGFFSFANKLATHFASYSCT